MPRVRVVHSTEYRYSQPVRLNQHRLMLRPRDSHDLRVLDTRLGVSPSAISTRWAHDVFGNSVTFVDFGGIESNLLSIVSSLELQHYPALPDFPLDPAAERYPFNYAGAEFPDLARLLERHYPDPDGEVDQWARKFIHPSGAMGTVDLLTAMTEAIKADFVYEARFTQGTNSPLVTLRSRRGACRDFAVLMMEAVRSLGLAARFISGYLYDEELVDSAHQVVGGGATHAWCAVYLPGAGWVEFDPTNGLVAGRNLIRVSGARTPEQAVPVGGSFFGKMADFIGMTVDVEVTVGDSAPVPPKLTLPEEEAAAPVAGGETGTP